MRFLITGGCGFLGSNLAAHVLALNEEVLVVDNLSRLGSRDNAAYLQSLGSVSMKEADIRDAAAIETLVRDFRPDVIFHLCGQVAMTTSIANPRADFEINVLGGINILEAARLHAPEAIITFSSTNKVYGDLETVHYEEAELRYVAPDYPAGFDESVPLNFQSPYGCSKGAMDQYMLDYARIFGLRTVVFRHSSIFGDRQFSTYDQGWVGWFVSEALRQKKDADAEPFTISGNGKQVRDLLFSSDLVACYFAAVQNIEQAKGQAFNIGGGMDNSLSLLELFQHLEHALDVRLKFERKPWRESDQKIFVADGGKAKVLLGWQPQVSKEAGLGRMIEWVASRG